MDNAKPSAGYAVLRLGFSAMARVASAFQTRPASTSFVMKKVLGESESKALMDGKLAHTVRDQFSADDLKTLKSYNFLTLKPFIYALNVSQEDLVKAEEIKAEYTEKLHAPVAVVCVKIEEEMMEMSTEEKLEFMAEMLEV